VFVRTDGAGAKTKVPVRVTIAPKFGSKESKVKGVIVR
jgi:hypothetical protein